MRAFMRQILLFNFFQHTHLLLHLSTMSIDQFETIDYFIIQH